ncbi:protoheme IX farnesyltransferase [Paenibacillus phyllosphaerae]|uniref:Protoheme IX farnesyltransferase n=1 Tax=Paenibacillus phyllosphaerae TaxID=274593 RepID=A0A7W5B224_9BACL|nr:heme o synthase [Paenibacillus phyllosphaerae]MBB3112817.1 protoheme IX farnesyltransferase [Paenibacillus phyllosphaerae]
MDKAQGNHLEAGLELPAVSFSKVLFDTIKTGIIKSNLIAMFAGLCMALYVHDIPFFDRIGSIVLSLIGAALIIGSAGAFNNLYDRDIDAIMDRTKNRPTVTGIVDTRNGLILGFGMAIVGLITLYAASPLAALFGFLGLFLYVVPYTMWTKRRTIYNTEVGSLSGAMPPLIGWAAISSDMTNMSIIALFALMVVWQMPHFYGIAIRRYEEYKAASVAMLPVVKGIHRTYVQTNIYLVLLLLTSFLFWSFSPVIAIIAALLSAVWLVLSVRGYRKKDDGVWGKTMFIYSLNHITIVLLIVIGYSLIKPLF